MNSPNPFSETIAQASRRRTRVKVVVFAILALHGAVLLGVLIQGCGHAPPAPKEELADTNPASSSEVTTQDVAVAPTNPPVVSSNAAPEFATTNTAPSSASGTNYIIAQGDTFAKIARTLHTTVRALVDANPGIEPTKLHVGQKINLPLTTGPAPALTAETNAVTDLTKDQIYLVKPGDYLLRIARHFGTTTSAIREANGLKIDMLKVGQKLKIPYKTTPQLRAG